MNLPLVHTRSLKGGGEKLGEKGRSRAHFSIPVSICREYEQIGVKDEPKPRVLSRLEGGKLMASLRVSKIAVVVG